MWELGVWSGKELISDESIVAGPYGATNVRTVLRLPEGRQLDRTLLDRIVGSPQNPKPLDTARDPVIRRKYITDAHFAAKGATQNCGRCMTGQGKHSETCRQRFEAIWQTEANAKTQHRELQKQQQIQAPVSHLPVPAVRLHRRVAAPVPAVRAHRRVAIPP
jgi:hypothetical protein